MFARPVGEKENYSRTSNQKLLGLFLIGIILFIFWFIKPFTTPNSSTSYIQDVQPILATKCYACHGPDEAKREAGLRLDQRESYLATLESGNTAVSIKELPESEIIKRITSSDPEMIMPPPEYSKSLNSEEIQIITKWIEEGFAWENHWSYEPIKEQEPPRVKNSAWSQNPIDPFILVQLQKRGLEPSDPADRRTLIRRLTFDLHGLPPSPEEVQDFISDASPDAYEKLVDRLLASPRYGERWARHWLDVVHYGETHGYDKDKRRPNAWPYRDYVIEALNDDIPYSRFVEDQLAGDVLHPEDPQATVALGLLATGPWDFVGHVEVKNGSKDKRIVRNLDRDDMVTTVISAFTGLTVQCARCHDHKFDAISQRDYYRLQAVFAGIDRVDRPFHKDAAIHITRNRLKARKKDLENQLSNLSKRLPEEELERLVTIIEKQANVSAQIPKLQAPKSKTFGYHSQIEQQAEGIKYVQLDLGTAREIEKITLHPAHPTEGLMMPGYGFPLRFKLEGSTSAEFLKSEVLADFTTEDHHERTDQVLDLGIKAAKVRYVRLTATRLWKGRDHDHFLALSEMQIFANGTNVARGAAVSASDYIQTPNWDPGFLTDGFDSRAFIRGGELPKFVQEEVSRAEREFTKLVAEEDKIRRKSLDEAGKLILDQTMMSLKQLQDSIMMLPDPDFVYAVASDFQANYQFVPPDSIRSIYRLNRGDTEQPMEEVAPGTMSTFQGLLTHFDLPTTHREGDRRAALAKWLTDERNAFTWRSIVNRVWQYHFGRGIVATPNDFGKMGIPPSHPELLDYLAFEFIQHGQSLKWLHRLMVTSATYQQQSAHHEKNYLIDSENHYLWRANRRQLEAEAVRDAVLAISGKLDDRMGGPGFDAFRYEDDHSPRYLYKDYDATDASSFRRAIYRFIVRSTPDPFMSTLDCADPSQSVPVRNESVTALQALATINNIFMVRQADFFAQRLKSETPILSSQISRAFDLALMRAPNQDESTTLLDYANRHGLAATCRLIFGLNEFLFVD